MNKIRIDEVEFVVKNIENVLEVEQKKLKLEVYDKNKIELVILNDLDLDIELFDDSSLELKVTFINKVGDYNINIWQHNRTNFFYKECFDSRKDNSLVIKNIFVGNDNKSTIKLRFIQYEAKSSLKIMADVKEKTVNNFVVEDVKALNQGGDILVEPDMMIATNEVMANHFVTIGSIRDEELFYLMSKGLSKDGAIKLILDGFLKSI